MRPLERLEKWVDAHVRDELEALGFKGTKGLREFRRKHGPHDAFTASFSLSVSKYSDADAVDFWTMWAVESNGYGKWHVLRYGEKPVNVAIASTYFPHHFELRDTTDPVELRVEFMRQVVEEGLAFFASISSYADAAKVLRAGRLQWDKAIDFYLLADEQELARETAAEALATLAEKPSQIVGMELQVSKRRPFVDLF